MKKNVDAKPASKSKMTVMLLQLEGSDDTIQQGFKALETALEKMSPKVITVGGASFKTLAQKANANSSHAEGPETDVIDAEVADAEEEEQVAVAEKKAAKKRTYATPKILTDVNFNIGTPNFKDYYAQLGSPASDRQKYLIVATWFSQQGTTEISTDHIYTAFRFMGWSVQKDVSQPFRTLKNEGLFVSGSTTGMYAVNHVGEEALRRVTSKS